MNKSYLKTISTSLMLMSLDLTVSYAMESRQIEFHVDQSQEYTEYLLINSIKDKPLQDALTFLTDYCLKNVDAAENLYQESLLYDSRNNPDIKNQDRLFVLDFVFKEKEMTYEAELKKHKFPEEPGVLKQRCLGYYPYSLCLSLAAILHHEKAQDRQGKIYNLMGIDEGKYVVWSPGYLENIEIKSWNQKEYIHRSSGEDFKESMHILGVETNLSVHEWNKAVLSGNGKKQKAVYEYYFQPNDEFRIWSISERRETYFYIPPHLKIILETYNNIRDYDDDVSFVKVFFSLIGDYMEKTVAFCESIVKTDKYDLILNVLQTSYKNNNCQMEGVLRAIENAKAYLDDEREIKNSESDLGGKILVLDEDTEMYDNVAKTYKAVESSYGKYLVLKEEVLKKDDQTLKMEDYKPLIASTTLAVEVARDPQLKREYCDQAINIMKNFFKQFGDKIDIYIWTSTRRSEDIEYWAMYLWRQFSEIVEGTGKALSDPEDKAKYYEKAIKYYKKDNSILYTSFAKKKLAELYQNVGVSTLDIPKKIENLTQSIQYYEAFCKNYDQEIDEKLKGTYFWVNRCDIEEIAEVMKNSVLAYQELAKIIGDPIKQQDYLDKAKHAREEGNYERQNVLIEEKRRLHDEMKKKRETEEQEAKRRKEEAEKRRKEEKENRWK